MSLAAQVAFGHSGSHYPSSADRTGSPHWARLGPGQSPSLASMSVASVGQFPHQLSQLQVPYLENGGTAPPSQTPVGLCHSGCPSCVHDKTTPTAGAAHRPVVCGEAACHCGCHVQTNTAFMTVTAGMEKLCDRFQSFVCGFGLDSPHALENRRRHIQCSDEEVGSQGQWCACGSLPLKLQAASKVQEVLQFSTSN